MTKPHFKSIKWRCWNQILFSCSSGLCVESTNHQIDENYSNTNIESQNKDSKRNLDKNSNLDDAWWNHWFLWGLEIFLSLSFLFHRVTKELCWPTNKRNSKKQKKIIISRTQNDFLQKFLHFIESIYKPYSKCLSCHELRFINERIVHMNGNFYPSFSLYTIYEVL